MRRPSLPTLGLVGVAAVMVTVDLGHRVLATNDEARFPLLARDILTRGAWLLPQLDGEPYFNKPPLMAWAIAALSWPAGCVSQLSAALAPALAAVAAALVVYGIGRDLFGARAGRWAAAVASTTQGFVEFARIPVPDMLTTLAITAGLWMLVRLMREPQRPWWVGLYACAALAFWTKGPAGLLPLPVALVWVAACRPDARPPLRPARGLLVVGVLIAPYWIGGLAANAEAVRRAVVTDQLKWYAPVGITPAAWAAPLLHAAGILAPWVVLLPAALLEARRRPLLTLDERRGVAFLLTWVAVVFVLIALSREQRFRYYLPLVPPVSLLLGWWLGRLALRTRPASAVAAAGVALGGLGLLLAYHLAMSRQNAAYDYPRVVAAIERTGVDRLAAWEVPELPLAFYRGRPVASVDSAPALLRALDGPPRGAAIVRDEALHRIGRRLTVLARDRLGGRPVSLVTAAPE